VTPRSRTIKVSEPQTIDGQSKHAKKLQAYLSLGIGSSNSKVQSIKEEVDKYLAVPSREEWDSIAFWEVQ